MTATRHPTHLPTAATFMVGSALAFACMGAAVKLAAREAPNSMVVFFRNGVALALLLPWALAQGRAGLATRNLAGHLVRGIAGLAAMACYFFAISRLTLADAVLLNQSFPLFIPLAERVWTGEPVAPRVWRGLLLGFLGIALILRPGSGFFTAVALVGLCSAVLAAVAQVGIRRLTRTEPVTRIVFYFGVIATSVSAVPLAWNWRQVSPGCWVALVATGVLATFGQLMLTRAYAHAPAALLGPFVYTGVVFAVGLDWLLWRALPDLLFVPGALLVAAAGAAMLRSEGRATPPARATVGLDG